MKHLGQFLKNHIETNHLKKRDVAFATGITYNYLSTIFSKASIDCALWEKLCNACGLNPSAVFESAQFETAAGTNISAQTVLGAASVSIGTDADALKALLAEKERTIQILMRSLDLENASNS